MSQYYNLDDSFINNSELDKMARSINNNKKKLNYTVPKQAKTQELNSCVGIDCLLDPSYARFAPSTLGASISQISNNFGDFTSRFPTPMMMNNDSSSSNDSISNDNIEINNNTITQSKLFSNGKNKNGTKISELLKHKNAKSKYNGKYEPHYDTNYDTGSTGNTSIGSTSTAGSIITIGTNSSNTEGSDNTINTINTINTVNSDSVFTDTDGQIQSLSYPNVVNKSKNQKYKVIVKTTQPNNKINKSVKKPKKNDYLFNTTRNNNNTHDITNNNTHINKYQNDDLQLHMSESSYLGESLISDVSSNYSSLPPKLKKSI